MLKFVILRKLALNATMKVTRIYPGWGSWLCRRWLFLWERRADKSADVRRKSPRGNGRRHLELSSSSPPNVAIHHWLIYQFLRPLPTNAGFPTETFQTFGRDRWRSTLSLFNEKQRSSGDCRPRDSASPTCLCIWLLENAQRRGCRISHCRRMKKAARSRRFSRPACVVKQTTCRA
jgi:hypothetical protein